MPLTNQQRQNIINSVKSDLQTFSGSVEVTIFGERFLMPSKVYEWWLGLPEPFKRNIIKLIGLKQTKFVADAWRPLAPREWSGNGAQAQQYRNALKLLDKGGSDWCLRSSVWVIFNPTGLTKWEYDIFSGENWAGYDTPMVSYRDQTVKYDNYRQDISDPYERAQTWLREEVLPYAYVDYVEQIEPKPIETGEPIYVTSPPNAIVLVRGKTSDAVEKKVMVERLSDNSEFITLLKSKIASNGFKEVFDALYDASDKTEKTANQQKFAGQGYASEYIYSEHRWAETLPVSAEYYQFNVVNYITQQQATSILNSL